LLKCESFSKRGTGGHFGKRSKDRLTLEQDRLTLERDLLTLEQDLLTLEQDLLTLEQDRLTLGQERLTECPRPFPPSALGAGRGAPKIARVVIRRRFDCTG
jgi:hypothetical protein